jgi:isopentenyldiphosphate isomerase
MEEYIDVLDSKTGGLTGEVRSKKDAHKEGLWHRAVHIWLVNSKKEILLQHRSKEKESHPNCWDISAAGHVSSGEDAITSALREVKEEIGLDISPNDLKQIGEIIQQSVLNNGTFINNEYNNVYLVKMDLDINQFKMQVEEVKDLRWISISEFKKWVEEKRSDLVPHSEEYKLILEYINKN